MRLTSVGSALGLLFGLGLGCHGDEFPTQENPGPDGELAITITTIGTLVDADGYVVSIAGHEPRRVGANQELVLSLSPGQYIIRLEDLSTDCFLIGETSWVRYVSSRHRAILTVEVDCRARGAIVVTTATQGSDLDQDGYLVVLNRVIQSSIGLQGDLRIDRLRPGTYEVVLRGLTANCTESRGFTRWISVEEGHDTPVSFRLDCGVRPAEAPGDYLVVASRGSSEDLDLFLLSVDGQLRQRLTDHPASDYAPSFSPDGNRVLFLRSGETEAGARLISLDRSSRRETELPVRTDYPVHLSPDGSRIAYTNAGAVWLANADGTGVRRLADASDGEAFWSPDGARIAFTRGRYETSQVYSVNVDGSGLQLLTNLGWRAAGPWSPVANKILVQVIGPYSCGYYYYYSECVQSTFAVLDLSNRKEQHFEGFGSMQLPTWEPEGDRILFLANGNVYAMALEGGNPVVLAQPTGGAEWFTFGRVR